MSSGIVYIADTGNNRIRRIDREGVISTIAGSGTGGYAGDRGAPLSGQMRQPLSVTMTSGGVLYISDGGNQRIRRVASNQITTVAGNGRSRAFADGSPAENAFFFSPQDILLGYLGNLFIADSLNHRVRRIGTTGAIFNHAGDGIADITAFESANNSALGVHLLGNCPSIQSQYRGRV